MAIDRVVLNKVLSEHAAKMPRHVSVRVLRENAWREWTFEEVWKLSRSAAGFLRRHGISSGRRVALYADNSPEWIFSYLGIYLAGGIVVPLDVQYTQRELQTLLDYAHCDLLLCSQSKRKTVDDLQIDIPIFEIDGESPIFVLEPIDPPADRSPDELMAVIFTSGTTGQPKGVCLSVGNIASNLAGVLKLNLVGPSDTVLALLPLHHCYAMTASVLVPLAVGGSITLCNSLRGPDILAATRDTGVSVILGVPKLFEGFDLAIRDKIKQTSKFKQQIFHCLMVLARTIRRRTSWNAGRFFFKTIHKTFGPRFRFFVSGGAKLDPAVAQRFIDLGFTITEGYGLTETSPVLAFNPPNRPKPGTVGFPIPGVEIKIDQPNPEGVGEIIVRGPNVMTGYDRRPDLTDEVIRDGWVHTGDLGFFDSEGYLHITGRLKEVIVLASGKNIYPEDLEHHFEQSPLIREICVMGVERSDGRVDRLSAVVVPDFDHLRRIRATGAVDVVRNEVARLSQLLPAYMHITDLKIITDELPRTRLGKLKRAEIRQMAFNELRYNPAAELTEEDRKLLELPGARNLIDLIRSVSRIDRPIVPADHLEFDLGLDSLDRISLDVILERDFGMKIPPEEVAQVNTVGDLIERLSGDRQNISAQADWNLILRQKISPPIDELFNLRRGFVRRGTIHALRFVGRSLSRRFFPLDIRGIENLPQSGPFLLCPTHSSLIDAVLIFMSLSQELGERMFFLGTAERFDSRVMRWIGRAGRVIPTATSDTLLTSLRRAAEVLERGGAVCVFPEGFITRDGFLQPPRPGAAILACHLNVPIVPVLIRGTYEILSYAHPGFRFRPVGLTFAPPISPASKAAYDNQDYAELMKKWFTAVSQMRNQDDAAGGPTAGKSPRIRSICNTAHIPQTGELPSKP